MQQLNYTAKYPWPNNPWFEVDPDEPRMPKQTYDPKQFEIQFFWPLTEQIDLDLNYKDCDTSGSKGLTISSGTGVTFATPTWTTNIAPTLSVEPLNSVGTLSIGGVNVGMEKEPNWLRKLLYKALGFKWHQK